MFLYGMLVVLQFTVLLFTYGCRISKTLSPRGLYNSRHGLSCFTYETRQRRGHQWRFNNRVIYDRSAPRRVSSAKTSTLYIANPHVRIVHHPYSHRHEGKHMTGCFFYK